MNFAKTVLLPASAAAALLCRASSPSVTEAEFVQDPNTHKATVSFTLAAESVVTVDIRTNDVSIGWRNFRSGLTGIAPGKVNPAGDYVIGWVPWTTWAGAPKRLPPGSVKAVITAWSKDNAPDFMDVDLTSSSNVTYYVSEDDLPYPVTDVVYKTSRLLMKRIRAANVRWTMGSPETEKGRSSTAKLWENQRDVVLSQDYYIGVFETTQGQWKNMTGRSLPSSIATTGDTHPMCQRSYVGLRGEWELADTWPARNRYVTDDSDLGRARIKTGILFDLPTEAQWEYACRGGTTTAFNTGSDGDAYGMIPDEELSSIARWLGNSVSGDGTVTNHTEVGSFAANGFGLYDTIGNVAELCLDFRKIVSEGAYVTYDPVLNDLLDPEGGGPESSAGASSVSARGSDFTSGNSMYNWVNAYGGNVYMHRSAYRGSAFVGANQAKEWIGFRLVAPPGAWAPLNSAMSAAASQDGGSRVVKFTYDLDEDAIVTMKVLVDGEPVDGAASSAGGDVNRLVKAGDGKMISWYPDRSLEGLDVASGRVGLKLEKWSVDDPPAYMALDLTTSAKTNIAYYSEGEVPGGATNVMFKTDRLLMRRIPAKDVVWWMGVSTNALGKSVETGGDRPGELRHLVSLSEDYFIGVFPLTARQLQLIDGTDPGDAENLLRPALLHHHKVRPRAGGRWPADEHSVSPNTVLGVLRTRSGGYGFDLPTEAQWEFACRALSGSAFCDGNAAGCADNGNTLANVTDYGWVQDNSESVLMPVGLKKANRFGLYDMHGNAWEWCLDFYDVKYGLTDEQFAAAQTEPVVNPVGATGKAWNDNIVLRGGSASQSVSKARSADRTGYGYCANIYYQGGSVGSTVRLVCPIVPGEE